MEMTAWPKKRHQTPAAFRDTGCEKLPLEYTKSAAAAGLPEDAKREDLQPF